MKWQNSFLLDAQYCWLMVKTATYYRPNRWAISPLRAGFGAILNSTLNVLEFQHRYNKNENILIRVPELQKQFVIKKPESRCILRNNVEKQIKREKFSSASNAHNIGDTDLLKLKNQIFNQHFKFKHHEKLLDLCEELLTAKTLGVHLRGTDKGGEIPPPPITRVIENIKAMIDKHSIERIFLATDDSFYLDLLIEEFGDLISTVPEHIISTNGLPIHLRFLRGEINAQVIEDMFLLSKCKYFLYSMSNVSYFALVLGINNFEEFAYIGAESHVKKTTERK